MRCEVKRAATVLGGAALAALCAAGSAAAAVPNPIIIQPNPVAPGGSISVFDGGNCDFPSTGTVTFQTGTGPGIPVITIGPLQNMIGGTGQVPANVTPGNYQVSLTCTVNGTNKKEGPFNGTLVVKSGASNGVNPNGGAKTGDGASLTTPGGLAEGIGLVGAGGAAWFLLRRRAARSNGAS
jgi:opacity protein-like surface antigen